MTLFSDGSTNWVTPSNVELEWADQTSVILEIQPGSPNTTTHSTVILSFISCSSKWSPSNSFSRRNPSANLSSSFQAYLAHLLSLTDAECRKSYYVLRFIPSTLFLHPFFRRNAFSAFRDLIQLYQYPLLVWDHTKRTPLSHIHSCLRNVSSLASNRPHVGLYPRQQF